jgi:hypothetical protein
MQSAEDHTLPTDIVDFLVGFSNSHMSDEDDVIFHISEESNFRLEVLRKATQNEIRRRRRDSQNRRMAMWFG